ncbi:MAG: NAD-dependent epimerase/dehydratase family protein [Chloroflexi bacterium]|nr:NAD-dependent epimerase/dehydratase family protein [Chloroflexota bacterium]
MKVLVTGATGFVGGNLVRALREGGFQVRALARRGSSTLNIEQLGIDLAWGDVQDAESVRAAVRGCEGVFHTAALYAFWARDRNAFYNTNVLGTGHVLQAAKEAGVRRVVHTSTWAVVGAPPRGGLATEASQGSLTEATGPYRRTKFLAEQEALAAAAQGQDVVVVNPTVPVGQGDWKPTPTGRLIVDFLKGRIPAYISAHLNLVDVEDVAQGHVLAFQKGQQGQRYILGNRNMTLREVLELLADITGRRPPRWRVPTWLALGAAYVDNAIEGALLRREPLIPLEGVMHAQRYMAVECSRAVRELGMPQTPIEVALKKAVDWYIANGYAKQ